MTLPFSLGTVPLPDWMPGWAPPLLLIPLLLYALLTLLVPFSTFGLKARLDAVEARLDEIQREIRSLSLRLPPAIGEEIPGRGRELDRPPIPPPAYDPEIFEQRLRPLRAETRAPRPDSRPPARAEPRL